jgi:tetratricopeptide (TPR) repeat protein
VQVALKDGMDEATKRLWAERAVRAVNRAFPSVEFLSWPVCDRLLAQAQACAELINQWSFEFPEAARLLNKAGSYLYERGRYTDAEPLFGRALAIQEKALGPEHPDLADSLNNLAGLITPKADTRTPSPFTSGRSRYVKRLSARSIRTWPPASTVWRRYTATKVSTQRPSPFTGGH